MILRLNEQEVTDSICVWAAHEAGARVWDVQVEDIHLQDIHHRKESVSAHAITTVGHERVEHTLHKEDIKVGIEMFLEEYHSFNRERMEVHLFEEDGKVLAEVHVNE